MIIHLKGYWNIGAFVFFGDETTVSVSGKEYSTSDRVIGANDIITIDMISRSIEGSKIVPSAL